MSLVNIQESNLNYVKEIVWSDATTQTTANTYPLVGTPALLSPSIPNFTATGDVVTTVINNVVPTGGYIANTTYIIEVNLIVGDSSGAGGLRGGIIIVTPASGGNPSEVTQQLYGNLASGIGGLFCSPSTTLQLIYTVPAVVPASGLQVQILLPNTINIVVDVLNIQFTPLIL
jgi:hypothetical protein